MRQNLKFKVGDIVKIKNYKKDAYYERRHSKEEFVSLQNKIGVITHILGPTVSYVPNIQYLIDFEGVVLRGIYDQDLEKCFNALT